MNPDFDICIRFDDGIISETVRMVTSWGFE